MNEDKIDDLFRSNGDYLADQPHRDFDPGAFWQQLRPELAQQKKKIAGRWWASAATITLALLAGGVWWTQSERVESGKNITQKSTGSASETTTEPTPPSASSLRPEEVISKSSLARKTPEKKAPVQPDEEAKAAEILVKNPGGSYSLPETEETAVVAATSDPITEVPAAETPAAQPEKPRYRIVHLNDIRPQKQLQSQNRPQVALRIGVSAASPPSPGTPGIQLSIPIKN